MAPLRVQQGTAQSQGTQRPQICVPADATQPCFPTSWHHSMPSMDTEHQALAASKRKEGKDSDRLHPNPHLRHRDAEHQGCGGEANERVEHQRKGLACEVDDWRAASTQRQVSRAERHQARSSGSSSSSHTGQLVPAKQRAAAGGRTAAGSSKQQQEVGWQPTAPAALVSTCH